MLRQWLKILGVLGIFLAVSFGFLTWALWQGLTVERYALDSDKLAAPVRIPFLLNGLFAPNQGWFPKYAGGRYQLGATTMIVSRGLQVYGDLPRVFNPPELTVISVK